MKAKSLDILESALLPPAQARAILQVMDVEMSSEVLATKTDLSAMKDELLARCASRADLAALKDDLVARFASKAELAEFKASLFEIKAELMRWMFIFWVGQMAATFALFRFLK